MELELQILDAGCRYGVHPSFNTFINCAEFHMFDVDACEIERLKEKYRSRENMHFYALGLYSKSGKMRFNHYAHKGLGSLADVNVDFIKEKHFMNDSFCEISSSLVDVESIDSLFGEGRIHFMKLDTEGSELEILKGAQKSLRGMLGLRIETSFAPLYKGCPLFGDIHAFLLEQGFELVNLDYEGKGHALSPYTLPNRYGMLIGSDGVWVKRLSAVLDLVGSDREKEIIFCALFLMTNSASDVAIDLLSQAKDKGMNFEKYAPDKYFILLDSLVQKLFKDLATSPYATSWRGGGELICQEVYMRIFGKEIKKMHHYYESL